MLARKAASKPLRRTRHRETRELAGLSGVETAATYTRETARHAPRRRTWPTPACLKANGANCCLPTSGDLKAAAARGAAPTATAKGLTRRAAQLQQPPERSPRAPPPPVEYVCAHVSMETLVTHTWRARTHVCCPLQCRNTVNPFPAPDVCRIFGASFDGSELRFV